jgi:hypothetical protein
MSNFPALGKPTGADERRARFFHEASAAFEFMAFYYSLSATDQQELQQYMLVLASKKK